MPRPDFDVDQSLEMEPGDGQEISQTIKISELLREAYFRHQHHVKALHVKHNELQRNLNEVNSDFTKLQSEHAVTLRELRLVQEENKLLKAQINYLKTRLLGPCQSCGNAPAHVDQVKQLFGEASQNLSSGKTYMDDGQKSRRDIQEISADSGCPNDQTVRKIEITQQSASTLYPLVKKTGQEFIDQASIERPETSPTNSTGPKLKLARGQKRGKTRYTEEILPSKKTRLSPTAGSSVPSTSSRKPRDILQAPDTQDIMNRTEPLVLAPETCALETQANTSAQIHSNSPRLKKGSGNNGLTGKRLGSSSDEAPNRKFTAMVIPETVPFGADIIDTSEDDEEDHNARVKFVKPPVCSSTPRDGMIRQGRGAGNACHNPSDQKKNFTKQADTLDSSEVKRTESHTLSDKTSESDTRDTTDIPSSPVFDKSKISKGSVVEDSMLSPSLFDEGDQKDICSTPTRKLNKRALDFNKATPPKVLLKSQNRVKILKDSSKFDTPKSDFSISGAPSPSLLSGEPEFVKKPVIKNPMDDFECLLDKEPAVTSTPTLTKEDAGITVGKSSKGSTGGLKLKSQRKLSQTVNTSSGNSGSPRLKQTTLSQAMCFAAVRDTRNQRKKGSQKEKTVHMADIDTNPEDGPLMTSTPFVTEQTTVKEAKNHRTIKDMKEHTGVRSSKADVTVADGPIMTSTPFVKGNSAEFRKPLIPSLAPINETSIHEINKSQDKAKDIKSLPSLDADESLQHADLFTEAGVNGSIADDIRFSEYDRQEEESQTLGECTAKSAVFGARKTSIAKAQVVNQKNKTMDDTDDAGGTSNKENAADDSFDIVPTKKEAPKFAHVAVVRKRNEREKLNAFACQECEAYFGEMDLPPEELKERMKSCRHRAEFAPVGTPPGFWDPNFPDTMECQAYMNTTQAKPSNFRRRRRYQKRFKSAREDHEESPRKMSEDEDGLVLT